MVEKLGRLPLDPGQGLRLASEKRRRLRERRRIALIVACSASPLALSIAWWPPLLLVWNASSSATIGFYGLHVGQAARRGEMLIARAPGPARLLAERRNYLPASVPLVKRVAATAGDRVCAVGAAVSIGGRRVATRLKADPAGRPMPWWNGCRLLRPREYFLLTDSPLSFDGRYFGVTPGRDVLGRAELLWAR